nr:MAG TPA: hypothetical protein [Caudoviricetes sp.]
MVNKKKKHINKQVIIYQGQSVSGLTVRVIKNTLPNYEYNEFLIQTTVKRDNELKSKIVAKSSDIRKVNELLFNLLGRKINLK